MKRCSWAEKSSTEIHYHDTEWGRPSYDDNYLFEILLLETMQAGLSWSTILSKREGFKEAYDQFDYRKIASYTENNFSELLQNPGIIRHKLKIQSTQSNAIAFLKIQEAYGSFSHYIWGFVDGRPIDNKWEKVEDVPSKTDLSDDISQDLKKKGFKFIGSTTIYSFLQAVGIVNDHMVDCFVREDR